MKIITKLQLIAAVLSVWPLAASSQAFDSGSNGSYGPLNVTSNTVLDLPPDGIFHCTTIDVQAGYTLSFNRNALNTPVYLLARSNIVVGGTVSVTGGNFQGRLGGKGGPGGFDGGNGSHTSLGILASAGQGPGAGRGGQEVNLGESYAGSASYGSLAGAGSTNNGATYGSSLLMPLVGGSGGGGNNNPGNPSPEGGGGGGGGAIIMASSTRITFAGGIIQAGGGTGAGGGSGGAIRLVSPRIEGTGTLSANGGGGGGKGRVRMDTTFKDALPLGGLDPAIWTIGSYLKVFPDANSRLDITQAAGTNIPEGTATGVAIELPFGSSTNRTVTVQARDFGAAVPIRLVLTPQSGPPLIYDVTIDNAVANPATTNINVTVPVNTPVVVHAWTR